MSLINPVDCENKDQFDLDTIFKKVFVSDGVNSALNISMDTFDPSATALINRMIAAGETPTTARKTAINNCIKSLKANSLFDTRFDALVITRGTGLASTKMNWISNNFNATGVNLPNYTQDVGYNSDGVTSYLKSNYDPSVDAVLYQQDDASFGFKISGSIGATSIHGELNNTTDFGIEISSIADVSNLNNAALGATCPPYVAGYTCISRSEATKFKMLRNALSADVIANSKPLAQALELHLLHVNFGGGAYFTDPTEVIECYWIGKSMTQAEFLTFQGIMNTYFAAL